MAYPGVNCQGRGHVIKHFKDFHTVEKCNDACDSTPGCAVWTVHDDWRDGCWMQKETCIDNIVPIPDQTVYIKPSMYL